MPSQSTLSRRTRTKNFGRFLHRLGERLAGRSAAQWVKCIDGKPLPVAAHSTDPDATWGRGAGQNSRGYKLHAIWDDSPMPLRWALTPLHVAEKHVARGMLKRLAADGREGGYEEGGYLLADGHYDASDLYDLAAAANHQLVAPRQHPGAGLGHHYQSEHRLRSLAMLEVPAGVNDFGRRLHRRRKHIERRYGNLSSFSGGLLVLPAWVRRTWRVRNWVHAKLLINAARIRCNRRRTQAVPA